MVRAMLAMLALQGGQAAYLKANAADPGTFMWLGFGGCPGMQSPVGKVAPVTLADPFLYLGMPSKVLDAKYLTADGKHLNDVARDTFFCNASHWAAKFGLTKILKGFWVLQSSYSWNLCGSGFRQRAWKGDPSLYMKTLEALGPAGVTVFFNSLPNRFAMLPETCSGISMPVTTSSLIYYHMGKDNQGNKLATGSLVLKAFGAFKAKKPMLISIPSEEANYKPFVTAGYVIALLSGIISLVATAVAAATAKRNGLKATSSTFVLFYEGSAGVVRALFLFIHAPFMYGPVFFNGMPTTVEYFLNYALSALGIPTTWVTSMVWLKFTIFRATPPVAFDVFVGVSTVAVIVVSFWASTLTAATLVNEGILAATMAATTNDAYLKKSVSLSIMLTISLAAFVMSNCLWIGKLSKLSTSSPQLAAVARRCLKIMAVQVVFIAAQIVYEVILAQNSGANVGSPILDPAGNLRPNLQQIVQNFLTAPTEAVSGLIQVIAIRVLSSSSSSSSSG